MRSLSSHFSSLSSLKAQEDVVVQICCDNLLRLERPPQTDPSSVRGEGTSAVAEVSLSVDPSSSSIVDGDATSAMEVLLHFLSVRYYCLPCASCVTRYILCALKERPVDFWVFVAPTSGSLLARSVVRTLLCADALETLYRTGYLLDYLEVLELVARTDPVGFVHQLALDEGCPTDVTALQSTMLVPGRLAQCIPHLSLEGIRPIVEVCERILVPLIRDDAQISLFLHAQVTPSPIRVLLENLFLMPRSAKGIRLTMMVSLVRVLCAATEASDPEVGRRWLEDFSLSEGPHQIYFTINEWAQDVSHEDAAWIDSEQEYSIPPPALEDASSPNVAPSDPLNATTGPQDATEEAFDPDDPLPCPEDKLLYDLLCLLCALPDDGSLYHSKLYTFLSDTLHVQTYLASSLSSAVHPGGSLSTLFEDRSLPSASSTSTRGTGRAMGLQLGFRLLVHAASATIHSRPALSHFLARIVVTILKCRGEDIVDHGLVTTTLCDVLAHLTYRSVAPAANADERSSTDGEDASSRKVVQDPLHADRVNAGRCRWFLDTDPQHNNEYLCYVSSTVTLFSLCCRSSTLLSRQEDGGDALARIVVSLIASKQNLISCAAIKAVMFHAISAVPPSEPPAASDTLAKPPRHAPSQLRQNIPPGSPTVETGLSSGALLYTRLIHAGLAMNAASELMCDDTAIRRQAALLELLQDVNARCPHLQSELVPLSTNLLQLMRSAAAIPTAHVLLPRCSAILSGLRIGKHDRAHVVCQSLLGMIVGMDPLDSRALVAASWGLQTLAQLASRERGAQEFCCDRRHDVFNVIHRLCVELNCLWEQLESARATSPATHKHHGGGDDQEEEEDVDVPAPGDTPLKKPKFFMRKKNASPHSEEGDVNQDTTTAQPSASAADADAAETAPQQLVDLCAELRVMFAFHRQRRDVCVDGSSRTPFHRYLMTCDVLTLSLHVVMVSHCLQQTFVADDAMPAIIHSLGAGPMLKCRLFTSIVTRCLIGLGCFATTSVLSEIHTVGKISMLTQPPPAHTSRITLQDLTCGWSTARTVGDQLFERRQHRIVRPQFIRSLLELMLSASPAPTIAGFELIVSVIELLYHVFHSRMENMYVLSMCGAWDAAVCQLVRVSTANAKLRSLCVHVISNAMRLFGLHGLSSVPVNCHLLLCFDATQDSADIVPDNVSRVFSSWEWLLNNCLPCRVPLSFFSLAFGCDCSTRQQRMASISGNTSTAMLKREVLIEGGVDVTTSYDVWKFPVDTHMTTVLWVMIDMSATHRGSFVLCSLHFDGNRVVVELCGDEKGTLFISVKNRKMGEICARRVVLGKLPTMPNKQWTMIHFTMENFASKSHASLRTKFAIKFSVGMQALHGNHHFFEASVETPDVEISQSLREKSLSTCTMLSHICIGGLHREGESGLVVASSTTTTSAAPTENRFPSPSQRRALDDDWQHTASHFNGESSDLGGGQESTRSYLERGEHRQPSDLRQSSGAFPATAAGGAPAPVGRASHQLFLASMALFHGELSSFDALVLFALGPDSMTSLDFLDKATVINLYPILARLTTDGLRTRVGTSLALLASMWLRRQDPSANESSVPQFTGYFPFSKASKDRVVCVLGAVQGDLALWSRAEMGTSSSSGGLGGASVSDLSMALTTSGQPTGSSGGGSHNASTLSPHSSFAPNMIGDSFAVSDKQMSMQGNPQISSSGWMGSSVPHLKTEFLLHPKMKPLVQVPLEVLFEDLGWRGGMLWEDDPQFLHRPVSYSVPPIYSLFEAVGGLQMFLWLATMLESSSPAHVLVFQCACTWLSLHYDRPMSDAWSGESSKSQDMTLLSGILHHRVMITRDIANCITKSAGYPVLARIDFIPLLLDFSLWARDADALNAVASYLCELQVSSNTFCKLNIGVLRYRRVGERHNHHVLEELLFHLHMRFAGSTTSAWDVSTIPSVRNLVALMCTDVTALTRIAASAAWLTTEEDAACVPWTLCLLDAAIAALTDGPADVMPANPELVPQALITHLTTILKCGNDSIRRRGLQCFVHLRELHFETVASAVSMYEARSIMTGPRRCITSAELRLLMVRAVGSDRWMIPDGFSILPQAALPHNGEGMAQLTASCPMLFFLIALVPYLPEAQQLVIIAFASDLFNAVAHLRRAMLAKSFCPERGLDDPFTSLLLYALAETLERSDRSLEVGDGAAARGLLESLVDIITFPITHAPHHSQLPATIDTLSTVSFTILNIFVEEEEIGARGPSPLFYCARRHILNLLCASLRACELQIHHTTAPHFVDGCLQLFELVNDLTTLLYIPSGSQSDESPTLGVPAIGRPGSPSNACSTRASQNHDSQNSICAYFSRHASTRRGGHGEDVSVLCVQRWYLQLLSSSSSTNSAPPVASSASSPPIEGIPQVQFTKAMTEVVPLYSLELSSRLHSMLIGGLAPVCAHMDKHRVAHKCSVLHQQQLRLITFLLTIETIMDDGQQLPDTQLVQLQTLCLLHAYYVGPRTFEMDSSVASGGGGGGGHASSPSTTAEKKKPQGGKPPKTLLKVPPNARWSEEVIQFSPESLFATAVARYKEPTIAILYAAVRFLSHIADAAHRNTPLIVSRATLAHNICRALFFFAKPVAFKKDLVEGCVSELERFANEYMSITSCFVDPRALMFAERLPARLFTPHGQAALQGHTTSIISRSVGRAKQNLRVDSSRIPLLDPQRAVDGRNRIDGGMQKLQAATMKRATFYEKTVEHDSRVILAVNAAYRFAMLPWWGPLSMLHTDQHVALNRYELDRFTGPDWERSRLRRFAHEPKMLASEGNAIRFQLPLSSVAARLQEHSDDRRAEDDDMELLSLFGVSAVPQSVHQRVLMQSESASHRCLLILPMDRVPVVLTLSHVGLLIRAEVAPPPRDGHAPQVQASEPGSNDDKRRPRGTLVRVFAVPQGRASSAAGAGAAGYRYKHEMHDRVVPMNSIRAVWPRRNLLQQVAVELLLDSGDSLLLSFSSPNERKAIMEKVAHYAKQYVDKTLVPNQNNMNVWRSWWCDGRISNFKYLMYLNFAAGRSYGDMRQYPVFPHVVGNYQSDVLDLRDPSTFRLLDKPMGAQIPEKEHKAMQLYESLLEAADGMEDHGGGGGLAGQMVWHYGTHYAPLACVLQSLVRVQPFGDYFLDMNSKLDEPDRVFESMANTYSNYTGTNSRLSKDVREMVPEFFCLPEMLVNTNEVPFGVKQDGSVVDNVQLPPWSRNPRAFVVALREALECQHTSERLHQWIDLIFGYKQRGKEAAAAVNLYHPLTYEKTIDLAAVEDPVEKKSHITQIDNFGQTPVQLFPRSSHKPRCKPNSEFYSIPCPTLRYEHAFAKSSVLLFPERLVPTSAAPSTGSPLGAGGVGSSGGGPPSNVHQINSERGMNGSAASWIVFCRSPIANAALGADELGDFFLSASVVSRSLHHVLPLNVLPFTVVADVPRDYIVVRSHTVSLVDAKDMGKDLVSARITKALTTVAAVQAPYAFIGSTCGAIHVVEVRFDDVVEVEVPQPSLQAARRPGGASNAMPSAVLSSMSGTNDGGRWSDLPDAAVGGAVDFFSASFDVKASKVKAPQIKHIDCLYGHHGTVVALTVASEWGILVSAAQDWVLAVWDLHRRLLIRTVPSSDLHPQRPISLFHQRILSPWGFIPQLISVNPLRGDIVVAGLGAAPLQSDEDSTKARGAQSDGQLRSEVRVFTINGELAAKCTWRTLVTALVAMGPVLFVADGRSLVVLDSVTLARRHELHHHALEDSIVSIAVNPYGTCVAAVDKGGNVGSWKVG